MPPPARAARAARDTPSLVPSVCAGLVVLGGLLVLLGWWVGSTVLVSLRPGLPAMRASAAVSLVLLGTGILLAVRRQHAAATVLSVLAAVLPALDILDWALGRDAGLDVLLFGTDVVEPGRLAPGAALNLLCLVVALAASRAATRVGHMAALLAGLTGLLGFSATLFDSSTVPQLVGSPGVPLHGAALVIVAALGILALQPTVGLTSVVREPGRIGTLVRQFTVIAVVLPIVVGVLGMLGIRGGRYDPTFAVAVVSTAWTAGMLALLWWGGRRAVPVERAGELSRGEAAASRDRLALLVEVSRDFAHSPVLDDILERVTRRIAEQLRGATTIRLVDPTGLLLVAATAYHPDPARQEAYEQMLAREVRIDQGLSGAVLSQGLTGLLENDVTRSPALAGESRLLAAVEEYGPPSAAVAALRAAGVDVGVIAVIRDEGEPPLVQGDLDLLVGLADRAAQAIHNAQLVAEQTRRDASFAQFAADALVTHSPGVLRAMSVRHLAEALRARHAVLLEPGRGEGGPSPLRVTAATEVDGRPALPIDAPVTAPVPQRVLRTGEPYVCEDMRHDASPEMRELAEVLDSDSGMAVAVPGREGPRGILTVVAVGRARFSDDEVDLARAFAGLLSGALQRMDAETSLARVAEERRALLDRLVSAQEDERARIADGVHQDQVQVIAAADLRLGVLSRRAGELDPALAGDLTFARDAVSGAAERLRALLFELEPPDPTAGLDDAVAEAAAYLLDPIGTTWTVDSDSVLPLSQSHLTTAYRIAKEALANAARHARAGRVEVRIADRDGGVAVRVADDGVGMAEVPQRSAAGHLGMSSMRDWVEVAGGRLQITSATGEGTTVDFWLPAG